MFPLVAKAMHARASIASRCEEIVRIDAGRADGFAGMDAVDPENGISVLGQKATQAGGLPEIPKPSQLDRSRGILPP